MGGGPVGGGGGTIRPRAADCGPASQGVAGLPLPQARNADLVYLFILLRLNSHNVKLIMLKEQFGGI